MGDYIGSPVLATAGRDKGGLFLVVGVDEQQRLLLADGKRRRYAKPKCKKLGHVQLLPHPRPELDHTVMGKLKEGSPVSDRELRKALAAFKEGFSLG